MAAVGLGPVPVVGPEHVVGPAHTSHMVCSGLDVARLSVFVCSGMVPGLGLLGNQIRWWTSTSEP